MVRIFRRRIAIAGGDFARSIRLIRFAELIRPDQFVRVGKRIPADYKFLARSIAGSIAGSISFVIASLLRPVPGDWWSVD